ncbi:MAG: hypothetical protein ACFFB3_21390 [Candidatus Hodarchaeota archaeon]
MFCLRARRMILPFGVFLIFLFLMFIPSPTRASTLFDPEFDVKYENTGERGRLRESIDILQVDSEGSKVIITCGSPVDLIEVGYTHRYLVLFSDDGNPTDWEAAIILTSFGGNNLEISWKIGPVTFEEAIGMNNWIKCYDMTYYAFIDNVIRLSFVEYPATSYAEMVIWTEVISIDANGNKHIFHDWAPDSLEEWSFEASEEVIIKPISGEQTSQIPSGTQRPTGSTTTSVIIPGFDFLSAVAIIPLIFLALRRQKRN